MDVSSRPVTDQDVPVFWANQQDNRQGSLDPRAAEVRILDRAEDRFTDATGQEREEVIFELG